MQFLGHYKAIVTLVILSALASAFYLSLWTTIDPENVFNRNGATSKNKFHQQQPSPELAQDDASSVIYQEHHLNINNNNNNNKKPLPIPAKVGGGGDDNAGTMTMATITHQLSLKEQLKLEKAAAKQRKLEEKERRRRRKQRIKDEENEPFPSLISTNNARVVALHQRAYKKFCIDPNQPTTTASIPGQGTQEDGSVESNANSKSASSSDSFAGSDAGAPSRLGSGSEPSEDSRRVGNRAKKDIDFGSYEEWIQFIRSKHMGQEPLTEPVSSVMTEPSHLNKPRKKLRRRPFFLERPLRGWIVNMTAIQEPCNRHNHSSAHCLAYLAEEHAYLVPSRQARKLPNSSQARKKLLDPSPPMDFHVFWKGPVTDKLSMSVHSFLFTQPLDRARMHVWIDSSDLPGGVPEDYEKNEYARPLVSPAVQEYVIFHAWDQKELEAFAYGPVPSSPQPEGQERVTEGTTGTTETPGAKTVTVTSGRPIAPPVALSDEARFLLLYRYGGMYLDADVLLLKDMSPFYEAGREFAYEWSNTEMYNTAILRLNKHSSVARRILDGAKAREKEILEAELRNRVGDSGPETAELFSLQKEHPPQEPPKDSNIEAQQQASAPSQASPPHPPPPLSMGSTPSMSTESNNADADNDGIGSSEGDSLFLPSANAAGVMATIASHRLTKRGEMRPKEIYHPARLRKYLRPEDSSLENNGLTMLPVAIFDPLWLRVDKADHIDSINNEEQEEQEEEEKDQMMEALKSFPDAFTDREAICPGQTLGREGPFTFGAGPEVFFSGAYAYHWHNNWKTPIEDESWMGLMRQAYHDFTLGKRPNLYGEWFLGNEST
ncbi:hypothetical protein BGZ94_002707 [Podila epigama]|nr:hypothetical protein BGZ94_002707 [Podila epigama]